MKQPSNNSRAQKIMGGVLIAASLAQLVRRWGVAPKPDESPWMYFGFPILVVLLGLLMMFGRYRRTRSV